jgi:hypothetical protein
MPATHDGCMRGLLAIVILFAAFAYDMSYNGGAGIDWVLTTLGVR